MPKTKAPAEKYPEMTFTAKDGRVIEVFRRKDKLAVPSRESTRQGWGWRVRRNGRVIATNAQAIERNRAIIQAKREAGPGAKVKAK